MLKACRVLLNSLPKSWSVVSTHRAISTTPNRFLKEVVSEKKDGEDVTVNCWERTQQKRQKIKGVYLESTRKDRLLPTPDKDQLACPLCKLNMNVDYTDVLILSQFLRSDGGLMPKRVTGLCYKSHKKAQFLIRQAQRAGLLSPFRPDRTDGKIRPHLKPYKFRRYPVHYDDDYQSERKFPFKRQRAINYH